MILEQTRLHGRKGRVPQQGKAGARTWPGAGSYSGVCFHRPFDVTRWSGLESRGPVLGQGPAWMQAKGWHSLLSAYLPLAFPEPLEPVQPGPCSALWGVGSSLWGTTAPRAQTNTEVAAATSQGAPGDRDCWGSSHLSAHENSTSAASLREPEFDYQEKMQFPSSKLFEGALESLYSTIFGQIGCRQRGTASWGPDPPIRGHMGRGGHWKPWALPLALWVPLDKLVPPSGPQLPFLLKRVGPDPTSVT